MAKEAPPPAVLVAAHATPAGTLLRPVDFDWKVVGTGAIRPGSILRGQASEADFVGALTRRDFRAGEAFVTSDLIKPNERQFLSAVLKPGMRAATISVDAPQSVAGLILPGDQVDVILTQSFGDSVGNLSRKTVAETVLRDVRIIAVDQSLSTGGKTPTGDGRSVFVPDASRIPKTVTFEVTDRQAERLFVAAQLGHVQLAVRPLEIAQDAGPSRLQREQVPTWASDVSPALRTLGGPGQLASPVEAAVRRPPSRVE